MSINLTLQLARKPFEKAFS